MFNLNETFHAISIKRKQYFNKMIEKYDLNLIEIEILAFLNKEPDSNTFTEIMKAKDYAKSHMSTAITHLVTRGYIEKRSLDTNKKVHKLYLLDKSFNVIKDYDLCISRFRGDAFTGISEDGIKVFEQVIHKMNTNLTTQLGEK
ncbi:MAG: MarR family winged helix-turn-helix transcriptional regulator [Eubacteriales bacterium]